MKKISWITHEGFIDVDVPVIRYLKSYYRIKLIIGMPYDTKINYENYITSILGNFDNVEIEYFYLRNRAKSLRNIKSYNQLIQKAKAFQPDLYYIAFYGMPYALPLYKVMLPIDKCVFACHNVSTPKGATNEKTADIYKNWCLRVFKNIQVFSEGQLNVLKSKHCNKNILLAYLMLKDYGTPKKTKSDDGIIRFLFFGNIVQYKRLDILIKAANILANRNVINFHITIAGKAKNWNDYEQMIECQSFFTTRIERIPNEDVADLFAESNYFVMPYQDIAQSGAITVAFKYNVPTIVSDIPQFKEFIEDGVTSLSFKSLDAESLANTMQYAIKHHNEIYNDLCINQKKLVEDKFADEAIVTKYRDYFDKIMS